MGSEEVVKGSISRQHLDDWHKPSPGWRQHLGAWIFWKDMRSEGGLGF